MNETGAALSTKVKTVTLARYLKSINAKEAAEKHAAQPGALATLMQLLRDNGEEKKKSSKPEVAVVMAEGPIVQGPTPYKLNFKARQFFNAGGCHSHDKGTDWPDLNPQPLALRL